MKRQKLIESGEMLPMAANTAAISSYSEFIKDYPIVKNIKTERWDFALTVAGIFVALSQLSIASFSKKTKEKILMAVEKAESKVYPDLNEAGEDCRNFVVRNCETLEKIEYYQNNPEYLYTDSLGIWILWNLLGREPDYQHEEEQRLFRILGRFVFNSFQPWWE